MSIFLIAILIAGAFAGGWCYWRAEGRFVCRLAHFLVPASAGVAVALIITSLMINSSFQWSSAKVAASVAMTHGYNLYPDPETGVLNGWIYGPVAALAMLPAALARDPVTVRLIGSAIDCLFYFLPAVWLLFRASRGRNILVAIAALALFGLQAVLWEDFSLCAFIASADGPALGLAACACAFVYLTRSNRNMLLSALAMMLSIWSKQSFIPLTGGIVLYIAIVEGWKRAAVYVGMFAGVGVLLTAIFAISFGPWNIFYQMCMLASHQPMRGSEFGTVWVVYVGLRDLLSTVAMNLSFLLLVLAFDTLFISLPNRGGRAWFAQRPWSILILVACFGPIISVPCYMIVGGWVNSFAPTDYFILLAGLAGAVETCSAAIDQFGALSRYMTLYLLLIFGDAVGLNGILRPTLVFSHWQSVVDPYGCPEEMAYQYTLKHPGEVYLPWDPLVTLMAEGKMYHFEWGFLDRYLAGRSPTTEHLGAFVPHNIQMVVYTTPPQTTAMQQLMPQFSRQVELPELPGCIVYVQGPTTQ